MAHYEAAVAAGPDLPSSHAALGCALARAGRLAEALPHLRRAVADQPFDAAAARALFQVLGDLGRSERGRSSRAAAPGQGRAPGRRPEPWFRAARSVARPGSGPARRASEGRMQMRGFDRRNRCDLWPLSGILAHASG